MKRARAIARRLAGHHDPVSLAARLDAPLLFRRTGGVALLMIDSALRLEARGGEAVLVARSEGGKLVLDEIVADPPARLVDRGEREAHLSFERCGDPDEAVRAAAAGPTDLIRAMTTAMAPPGGDEPFAVTALGLVAFDHVDMIEALPPRGAGEFPDLVIDLAETLVVIEASGAARVLALVPGSEDEQVAHRLHHQAVERLAQTVARCEAMASPPSLDVARGRSGPVETDVGDAAFAAIVERLKRHIAAGDIFQVVPSRAFRAPCDDPRAAFARLVAADPGAYHYHVDTGHGVLIGASPETAVEVRRDGEAATVIVRPIAGTRPRGASPDADDRLEADLRLDAKEVAEHMMLVDLARNDVARVSKPGSRRVERLLDTLRFSRVMHLESTVAGTLAEGRDAIDAMRACLNVGTLSGAPKARAMELIRQVEVGARGPYGGAVGYWTGGGDMDTAVVIRSALVRGGMAEVRAGAGVVADSDPLAEAAETRAKASAMLAALGAAA